VFVLFGVAEVVGLQKIEKSVSGRWLFFVRASSGLLIAMMSAVCLAAAAAKPVDIVQSLNDTREYQYLTLENDLQVLLISDPSTDKAAAALDVAVGSGDDPRERQGLAHFLEHMLFLGTEKYPAADDYQSFISQSGGSHNAYTSNDHTNYFFDVEASNLEPALDRFAQFFLAPLFSAEYVSRERHAVDSEYKSKIQNDYRRQLDVLRQLMNKKHPLSGFSVGSLETLADRDDASVRDDLLAFYKRHYSSDRMTLVVLGRESLVELDDLVRSNFTSVEKRPAARRVTGQALFRRSMLPAQVDIKPIKDQQSLTLMFPIPSAEEHYRQKPLQYLGNILGHEGEGSLLSRLKSAGWAEGLSAGAGFAGRNQGTFSVSIQLTPEGLVEQDKVVATTFKMIQAIREKGVEAWRFEEQQQLSGMAFDFSEKAEPIHTVSRLANNLHQYAPEHVLKGDYLHENFDARLVSRYLRYLKPDNVLRVVTDPRLEATEYSPYYETPYRARTQRFQTASISKRFLEQLKLPVKNPFIPKRLALKQHLGASKGLRRLKEAGPLELWHQHDTSFGTPKSSIKVRVKSPVVGQSVQMAAQAQLFAELASDALNEFSYPAALAGLHYQMTANSRGFDISVSGYNDRQGLLLKRLLDVVQRARFAEERFDGLKAELLRRWRNSQQKTPYQQLFSIAPATLYDPYWHELEMADALDAVSFAEFKQFVGQAFEGTELKVLMYGNVFEQEALKLGSMLQSRLHKSLDDGLVMPEASVVRLSGAPLQQYVPTSHPDSAVVFYLQGAGDSVKDAALNVLLRQNLQSSFFHRLRTEKQLGYIVFVSSLGLKSVPGSVFVVQSPTADVNELIAEINGYRQSQAQLFKNEVPEFLKHKTALLGRLEEKPKNLAEQAGIYWQEIVDSRVGITYREQLVAAVKALDEESFRVSAVSLLSQPAGVWFSAGPDATLEALSDGAPKLIGDAVELKSVSGRYRYP